MSHAICAELGGVFANFTATFTKSFKKVFCELFFKKAKNPVLYLIYKSQFIYSKKKAPQGTTYGAYFVYFFFLKFKTLTIAGQRTIFVINSNKKFPPTSPKNIYCNAFSKPIASPHPSIV